MRQIFACLLLLFMWDVSASSPSLTPDMQEEEESAAVVEVTGVNHDAKDAVIDIPPDTMAMQYPAFRTIDGISVGGVGWINGRAADIFKNLTEDQQRAIISNALAGNFSPGTISVNFWKAISCVSDPIGNLAKVAVVVLPLIGSSGYYGVADSEHSDSYGPFAVKMGIATSVAGVISLTFDKICYYANEKIANHEKEIICLRAMRDAMKDD